MAPTHRYVPATLVAAAAVLAAASHHDACENAQKAFSECVPYVIGMEPVVTPIGDTATQRKAICGCILSEVKAAGSGKLDAGRAAGLAGSCKVPIGFVPTKLDFDCSRSSVEKYPNNPMLGRRRVVDGEASEYAWMTYKEVYDVVMKLAGSISTTRVKQACNALGVCTVPLYDSLGAGAVEFIICHAEIQIAFVEEKKIKEDGYYDFDLPEKKKSDICTILYTSGTTGEPKGVMVPNESLIANILSTDFVMKYVGKADPKLLVDDIATLRPTILCAVPRVLDKIYSGLTCKISSSGILKKTLFNTAYKLNNKLIIRKLARMHKGTKHEKATPLFDKLVFSKVKEGLGGQLRVIVSAGAPLAMTVEEFFRVATCAYVVQVYGLTEICGGISVSIPNEFSMLGTVGPPIQNIDVRLESVPEMGYDALSRTPRGEICVRGSFMYSGYYKRDDLTQEVMIDEWFHTGDIGEWIPDGSLKIIDRKKNIFKLSQGEYVAAENLENMYNALQEIDSLRGFEFIKAIHLDPIPFDMERNLITPTFKKKRPQMLKHYQGDIDAMYMSVKQRNSTEPLKVSI
nr:unnamed protein product [Digitaria exilis]